jgi:hypothetical protein
MAVTTDYAQGMRTLDEAQALATLRFALNMAHGEKRHLTKEHLATPRHLLPFRVTLHFSCCEKCAAANRRAGGTWKYAPERS